MNDNRTPKTRSVDLLYESKLLAEKGRKQAFSSQLSVTAQRVLVLMPVFCYVQCVA